MPGLRRRIKKYIPDFEKAINRRELYLPRLRNDTKRASHDQVVVHEIKDTRILFVDREAERTTVEYII
jgi:hypothetical protein